MAEEEPQSNTEPEAESAPAPAMPLKGLKKISPIYMKILAGSSWIWILIAFVVALAVIMAIVSRQLAEPTADTTAKASGLHCTTWSETPVGFQSIIEDASAKFGIRPALLAAIYKQENGDNWRPKRWAGEEAWPVSPPPDYAAGPFQFIPATWSGEINKSVVKNKCGTLTKDDVNDKVKASCVAAYYLSDKLKNSGISNELDTEDEQDIKDVAVAYTSSFDYFDDWRKSGRDPSKLNSRYLAYHTNVWRTFNDLNKGCASYTSGGMSVDGLLAVDGLHQCDPVWNGTMCNAGCRSTSLAMIDRYFGGDKTPVAIAQSGLSASGYIDKNDVFSLAEHFTTKPGENFPSNKISEHLRSEHPILMRFRTYTENGKTGHTRGHYVVIVGMSKDNQKIYIQDPYGWIPTFQPKTNGNPPIAHLTNPDAYGITSDGFKFEFWAVKAKK